MKTAKLVPGPATSKVVPPITSPKESDYNTKRSKEPGLGAPVDTFLKKTESHEKRVQPGVKAKDLSGSLKETHGASGATEWERGGDKKANPSIRSFAGSKPNRVK